ncbi:hypothetical protein RRG08_058021 [Elysia crispata]|uniref:Reverse transcriptase domain-containing protein n=1 Tax=Elysia crispata TaxID=231223 RepID=A0AAE1E259_9GAST|nr:hypothetical protein RRG08_058021 [Elysia crispata]
MPKLPAFVDRKDDLDSWLLRFERFATTSGWPKESWCTPLSALLTGRALEAFCRLSETEATDYDRVKEVLQKRYNLTEDGYRQRFRTCSPEEGENPSMFIVRLKTYLERWMKLAEAPHTYEALRDLFVKEQFLDSSPADLSTYLRERRLADLEEVARSAELFLTARKRQLSDRARQGTTHEQNKPPISKKEDRQPCGLWKPKDQHQERMREKQTPDMTSEPKSKSGKRVPAMIDCGACGGKGSAKELNLPIVKGLVGDKTVDVLRDTGCEGVVVRRGLVDDDQLTGKCCLIVRIDNTVLLAEKARIQVKTPYLSGEVEALCIPEVICDLVVGNVPGARNPDDTDTTAVVGAVTTRAQARQEVRHRPLTVPDTPKHTGVDQRELIRLQQDVEAIKRMGETVMSENRAGRTSFFEEKEGIVYRVYNDATRGGANVRQVVLPEGLRKYVMSSAHDTTTGGHSGIKKTREKIMSNFYWPGIYKDVARYCRSCDICQKTLRNETSSRVLDVSSQTRDDLNVPSCVAVVEDYDYEADNGQDNLAGDEQGSEDLPEIGTWAQKEDAADVKFGEALTYDQNRELQMLVQRFSEIFSDRPGDTNLAEHRIDLTSDVPVRQTPYAVPFALKSSLKKELQQMEDLGIIRKSDSPYASPVVVVKKKDVSNRICIDFRRLNKITVTDLQPVPSPAESFLGMSEDKYFSKLDLTKGYHQIRVRPSDVHKTAFVTMGQHYEFLRMPFGMVNSGMTMTRAVRRLLEGMDNVVDYIDDLLVHTKTWEEHLQVLEELFERLKAANLVANWEQHKSTS